ncbi:MAG: beta-galactosidase [Butyrivibrio sp.]|nr:beta-galactosidase [Butyrivibrio sp.]
MQYGVDYYPEHWDKKDYEEHARLMKEAGFNVLRTAEFAWSKFEPRPGEYDFAWLDEAMEIWQKYGIKVVLGTPTAAPPKWLNDSKDILMRDRYGRKRAWGSRRECCANSPDYIEASKKIVEKMAQHYANNPAVIGWQIDNEFGCHNSTRCYCENCRQKFAKWLENKYSSIDELNQKWGTAFWSLTYDSFEDVILPAYNSCEPENAQSFSHNPSLDLEYRRFASDSWVDYQKIQIDIIRKYSDKPINTNMMGHFADIDYYNLAKDLDYITWDNYPQDQWNVQEHEHVSMAHEIMRGLKNQNFVVTEEQSGPCGWDVMGPTPEPGQIRLWAWQAIAHGGEGILYFRFKALHYGMEQYWYGVLDHDGIPGRRFYEIQKTGREFQKLEKYILGARNNYEVMMVRSYDNIWAHDIKKHAKGFNYHDIEYAFFKANNDLNIQIAVSKGNYEGYKIVYMPAYNIVDEKEMEKVTKFVEKGGVLVTSFRSGQRDEYNNIRLDTLPGAFKELAGIEIEEFDAVVKPTHICGKISSAVKVWADVIKPVTAESLCYYSDRYFKAKSAVTVNEYGKGRVYYIGCDLEQEALKNLVRMISQDAKVTISEEPEGIEIVYREGCEIILNHNDHDVITSHRGISLLDGEIFDGRLNPYGVEVLEG